MRSISSLLYLGTTKNYIVCVGGRVGVVNMHVCGWRGGVFTMSLCINVCCMFLCVWRYFHTCNENWTGLYVWTDWLLLADTSPGHGATTTREALKSLFHLWVVIWKKWLNASPFPLVLVTRPLTAQSALIKYVPLLNLKSVRDLLMEYIIVLNAII